MQVLYIDTLFFINFGMNFLALYLTAMILHLKKRMLPFLFASVLGGIYAVGAVLLSFAPLVSMISAVGMAMLLCCVAFVRKVTGRRFWQTILVFYLIALLLGGFIEAVYSFLESIFDVRDNASLTKGDAILLLGCTAAFLIWGAIRLFGGLPSEKYATVSIFMFGKNVRVPVLVDSGCLLADPISGKPAIPIRLELLSNILPSEIVAAARSGGSRIPTTPSLARRCRLLPAKSVGKTSLLLSIKPDRITVSTDSGKEAEFDALIALIAVEKNHFGGCDGLIPSSLLVKK